MSENHLKYLFTCNPFIVDDEEPSNVVEETSKDVMCRFNNKEYTVVLVLVSV